MQRDELYLQDIVAASESVSSFISGIDQTAFLASELIQSAVLQKLTVIGEAAANISEATRQAHSQIPWRDISAFRNIAVHAYFKVDWSIVWTTAIEDVPQLSEQIKALIHMDGSGGKP